jgi:hypothetical protein
VYNASMSTKTSLTNKEQISHLLNIIDLIVKRLNDDEELIRINDTQIKLANRRIDLYHKPVEQLYGKHYKNP